MEVAIAGSADTTIVVVTPGWGDAVQVTKAGLLEIGDVLVVNKADRGGAEEASQDLDAMLRLVDAPTGAWRPPVVTTSAVGGEGVAELEDAVGRHRSWLVAEGELDRRRHLRLAAELRAIVERRLERRAAAMGAGAEFEHLVGEVAARRLDPWSAADALVGGLSRER